ncbi:unnamed protein product, partial [Musa textilis]
MARVYIWAFGLPSRRPPLLGRSTRVEGKSGNLLRKQPLELGF